MATPLTSAWCSCSQSPPGPFSISTESEPLKKVPEATAPERGLQDSCALTHGGTFAPPTSKKNTDYRTSGCQLLAFAARPCRVHMPKEDFWVRDDLIISLRPSSRSFTEHIPS